MARPFLFRHSTWRGTFVDLWTVPHVISGLVISYLALLAHMSYDTAFWMALSVGIGWELIERITRLSRTEAYTNSLSDIVGAQLGFIGGWWLFSHLASHMFGLIIILAISALFSIICLFGYRAFKYYG
jgi:hypothetical protein